LRRAATAAALLWALTLAAPVLAKPGFGIKGGGTSSGSGGRSSSVGSRSSSGSLPGGRSSGGVRSGGRSDTGGRVEPRRPGFGLDPNYRSGSSSSRGGRTRDRYFDGRGHDGGYRLPNSTYGGYGYRYNRGGRASDRWKHSPRVSPLFFFGTPFYSPYLFPYDPLSPIYGYYDVTERRRDRDYEREEEEDRAFARRGNVLLDIVPRDVEVRIDGVLTTRDGRAALDLPTGNYTLEVSRAGYATWTTELVVRQGIRYQIEHRLERLPGQPEDSGPAPRLVGELFLDITPEDAIVTLDGRLLGVVSLLRDGAALRMVPVGRHKLEIRRPGYRTHVREIEVNPREPLRLQVTLERE
jgi:hypothetical protein